MPQTELFWALLEDGHPLEDLKKLNLEGFHWSERRGGTTLLVARIAKALYNSKENDEQALNTIEWLICSGASIEQKCTGGGQAEYWPDKPKAAKIRLECKGLSAISFVQALQWKMWDNSEWRVQEAFLTKVLSCFVNASSRSASIPRVSVPEGIAELWEKSLAAKDSHDLTIETADGLVTAHAHFLKTASSVVAAMLESPMKEGKAQRIEIKDTSSKAASLFLEILYTCSVQDELAHETALETLDLAHRWQAEVVVVVLTDLLAGMITYETFGSIGEQAVLKGLERLKAAAQRFGVQSKKVQADLKAGRLSPTVAQLFPASKPSKPSEPKPKRRRV